MLINAIESFIYWAGSQLTIGDTDLACDWRAPIQTEARWLRRVLLALHLQHDVVAETDHFIARTPAFGPHTDV